jgi:hypothetical protein
VTWRLCTIAGSCKYAVEEDSSGTPGRSRPAAAGGLRVSCRHPDRNELGALLVAAGRIVGQDRPVRRDRQDRHAPHAAARRHRQFGRGCPATRSAYAGRVRCLAGIFVRRRADWRVISAVRRGLAAWRTR